ncbi:hypothetical protein LZ31DRAFT_601964 [Colletotrichum somersetense]|nr:hypothetical protein LZ31DRAFT_601964 [Colletotrichum somersetense]
MLRAIFGDSYNNMPNNLPTSAGITSSRMLAFFLFWLIHLGFCFFRPYQLAKSFRFKGFIMLPAVFGVFIYCMVATGGKVSGNLPQSPLSGGIGWLIMHAINSGMGNLATLITNQPDVARWSKTRHGPGLVSILVKPISCTLSASLGVLATAAINGKWGLQL